MIILFLFVLAGSVFSGSLSAAAGNNWLLAPHKKTVQSGGFSPAPVANGAEAPARLISYQCDQEEIIFDTQFLGITFGSSGCFQNRYSRNQNFSDLVSSLCHGLKNDQVKLLIGAIGKNNEAINGKVDAATIFAQRVNEQDVGWLLKKTRRYGVDYVHSALITRIASEPKFALAISDNCQLTDSTYLSVSTKIDRERLHEIITGCLKEIVQLREQHGNVKDLIFDRKDPARMFLATSCGIALYDFKKGEITQEFIPKKDVQDDGFVCCDRDLNYCFELSNGKIFLWELLFIPARRSELKLPQGVLQIGLNGSDTQFFVQYKDTLLTYDIAAGESKPVQISQDSHFFKEDEKSCSVYYKDDDTLCIQRDGELCFYNQKTGEQSLIRLSLDRYQVPPQVIFNRQGMQAILAFSDRLFLYDITTQKEFEMRLSLKKSEVLIDVQFCDDDKKLLMHTGYNIHVYDLETKSHIASYPILPQYNKLMYRSESLIAVSSTLSKFVIYPYLDLKALNPKQILFLLKASAYWHINRKYGVEKEDHEIFASLPEQIKSHFLFYSPQEAD